MGNWPLQPGCLDSKLLVQLFMWILATQTHDPEQVLTHIISRPLGHMFYDLVGDR